MKRCHPPSLYAPPHPFSNLPAPPLPVTCSRQLTQVGAEMSPLSVAFHHIWGISLFTACVFLLETYFIFFFHLYEHSGAPGGERQRRPISGFAAPQSNVGDSIIASKILKIDIPSHSPIPKPIHKRETLFARRHRRITMTSFMYSTEKKTMKTNGGVDFNIAPSGQLCCTLKWFLARLAFVFFLGGSISTTCNIDVIYCMWFVLLQHSAEYGTQKVLKSSSSNSFAENQQAAQKNLKKTKSAREVVFYISD